MTKEERKSCRIAQKLVDALVELELFIGDSDMILDDALVFTKSPPVNAKLAPSQALELRDLIDHMKEFFSQ